MHRGAVHHIMARGIERRKVFRNDDDRDEFLERLALILTETQTPCYAWSEISLNGSLPKQMSA
jgi:putative transposase